ncbi:TonB family C-terminal domain-containing protein [Colwellia chukchiensis]|uniref:Protein TonB n=1 Tax=Colwellia chukchiensis TaxID=641665 RepID=A0A1H7T727_9GAMM|nr:M56 family metallopeptidase [Colwellia chukchiensis]SEL80680.1 TonB family C-terminal domain-containing protein [Colwellia chukchiensis]
MMPESLFNSPIFAALAVTLIHFLWQGVLVALVLKMLLSLISYRKPQLRYALSTLAMLANLLLPFITFFVVYDNEYRHATSFIHTLPLLDQSYYFEHMATNAWYIEWLEYLPILSIIWLSIVSALALKLTIELYNVNQLSARGCVTPNLALQARFDALVNKVALRHNVKLLISNSTNVPMAIGWLKPVVLIPFSMLSGLSPQQLDMLLLHELAHIRRHDYLVNFFQTLIEILLFFHPCVRWVSKQMRNEREFCSDDIAVQHSGCSLAYAHTLTDTASLCQQQRQSSIPSMAMAASGGDLKLRVVRLLDQHHCSKSTESGKWLASATILIGMIFLIAKHSPSLPVIDLQSGSISLQSSTLEFNNRIGNYVPKVLEQSHNSTSLARQLLAIDGGSARTSQQPTRTADSVNQLPHNPTQDVHQAKTVPNNRNLTNQSVSSGYENELPIVQQKANTSPSHHQSLSASVKSAAGQSQLNDKLTTTNKKSISELAFERTDSKNAAVSANPYSQQLVSLLNEPEASSETHIAALSKTHYGNSNQLRSRHSPKPDFTLVNKTTKQNTSSALPTLKSSLMAAKLLRSVEPKYPIAAKRKGIELEIMVEFTIDKNGLVKDIQFESKNRASYFRNTIRNAMEKWRFLPAKENGRAVPSKMSKIFSFSLLR